jgi:hypothetical protein
MKKILFLLFFMGVGFLAKAQTNPFPSIDSLEKYINRYIRNSPVEAFQNLRMNTSLIGMARFIRQSAIGSGVDTMYALNDSTLRLVTYEPQTFDVVIRGTGGTTNTNLGSGLRILIQSSQGVRTIFGTTGILVDSTSNTNALTFKVDTSVIATQFDIVGIGQGINVYNSDSTLSSNRTITQSGRYLRLIDGIPYTQFNGGKTTILPDSAAGYMIKEIKSPFSGTPQQGIMSWYEHIAQASQTPLRPNYPYIGGWNMSSGGGLITAGVPALGFSWEPNYKPDPGTPTLNLMEKHILYVTPQGVQRRPESYTINTNTNQIQLYHTVNNFDLRDTVDTYWSASSNRIDKTSIMSLFSKGSGAGAIWTADSIADVVAFQPMLSTTDLQMNQWDMITFPGNSFDENGFITVAHNGDFNIQRISPRWGINFKAGSNVRASIMADEGIGQFDFTAQIGYGFRWFTDVTETMRIIPQGGLMINTDGLSDPNQYPRGLYVNRSIGANMDSIPEVAPSGIHQMAVYDTTTGRFYRSDIPAGGGGSTDTTELEAPLYVVSGAKDTIKVRYDSTTITIRTTGVNDSALTVNTDNISSVQRLIDTAAAIRADIPAISGLSDPGADGVVVRTGPGTTIVRTLQGTTNRITVTNGDGVAGHPTFDIGSDVVTLTGSQTLTNKTLTTPTIGSFANAGHNHENSAGGGQIDEDAFNFTDVNTMNSTTGRHGLLPKLSGNAANFLDGTGNWSTPAGSSYTFSTGLTESGGTVTNNLSTGIASANQTAIGSTLSGGTFTLSSTSHATKGKLLFGASAYDEVNDRLVIGATTANSRLDITTNSIGVTQTNTSGIVLSNNTAAALGAQQKAPALRFRGNGWGTTGSASQTVDVRYDLLPVQGTTAPTWQMLMSSSINGGAYTNPFNWTSDGSFTASGQLTAGTHLSFAGQIIYSGRFRLAPQSDGVVTLFNNAQTDFGRLQFGNTTASFPALKRSGTAIHVRLADDSGFGDLVARGIQAQAGTSTGFAKVGGNIWNSITITATSGTSETDLHTFTTLANTLSADGEWLEFEIDGIVNPDAVGGGATKTIRVYWAGTEVSEMNTIAGVALSFKALVRVVRTSSSNARVTVIAMGGSIVFDNTNPITANVTTTFTNTNIIKITGQTTGATDLVNVQFSTLKWFPANL